MKSSIVDTIPHSVWVGIISITTLLLMAASYIPNTVRFRRTPPDRVDIMLHRGFMPDYQAFLSRITRGAHGSILFQDPFASAQRPRQPIYLLYTGLGFVFSPFRMPPQTVYHIGKIISIVALVISYYLLSYVVFTRRRWAALATFIMLIAPRAPDFLYYPHPDHPLTWWDGQGPVGRLDYPPHHTFALGLATMSIAAYLYYGKRKKPILLAASALSGAAAVLTIPHAALPITAAIGLHGLWSIMNRSEKSLSPATLPRLIAPVIALLPMLIVLAVVFGATNDPIWNANKQWEIEFWKNDPWFLYHYYITFGLLLIPAYFGALVGWRKNRCLTSILVAWSLLPILASPFASIGGFGVGRLLHMGIYIPLSCLTVWALQAAVKKRTLAIVSLMPVLAVLVYAPVSVARDITAKTSYINTEPLSTTYYPPRAHYEAAMWIRDHLPKDTQILAGEELGSLIAAFAPVFVYIGGQTHGYNWDIQKEEHIRFYGRLMTEDEARVWLVSHAIEYVVYDPYYIWPAGSPLTYASLKPVWSNGTVGVYRVLDTPLN